MMWILWSIVTSLVSCFVVYAYKERQIDNLHSKRADLHAQRIIQLMGDIHDLMHRIDLLEKEKAA